MIRVLSRLVARISRSSVSAEPSKIVPPVPLFPKLPTREYDALLQRRAEERRRIAAERYAAERAAALRGPD